MSKQEDSNTKDVTVFKSYSETEFDGFLPDVDQYLISFSKTIR